MTQTILNNRYQVLRVLGSGGFGKTFLAEDTQMPSSRRCVIKQLIPVTNNPQVYQLVQQRFQQEAAILEELGDHHSQIPRLYAYLTEGEEFYLVQEYIEGQTLSEKIRQQGILDEITVKEILINTLQILEYVHSKGIVHRDIKPDNIILRFADGKPVLIDFGAVKVTMSTAMSPSGNSSQSIVIGTPGFMPMEQSVGRPVFSSDFYSLGLTAIYMLTGKYPQDLPTEPTVGNILWRQFAPYISPNFVNVLDKAIQQSPRDRYLNARDMLVALQSLSNPTPPTAPVPQPEPRSTVIAAPASNYGYPPQDQKQIYVSSGNYQQPVNQNNNNNNKTIIILAGIIATALLGSSIIIALSLNKQPQNVTQKTDPQPQNSPLPAGEKNEPQPQLSSSKSVTPPPQIVPNRPTQLNKIPPPVNQPISIGWMRLGAVSNTSGTATVGEMLIETTQPVTISPAIVPSIGNQVTVINGVNLRVNRPQAPAYKLPDKKGVVAVREKLVIMSLDYFVDPYSPSPYTVVWAEVGVVN